MYYSSALGICFSKYYSEPDFKKGIKNKIKGEAFSGVIGALHLMTKLSKLFALTL